MKIKSFEKRDREHHMNRRNLIKWTLATGAALGLPLWKTFEVMEHTGGYALAGPASCYETLRSVHIQAGDGGLGWFTQLYPHPDMARAMDGSFTFHRPGEHIEVPGADHDLVLSPDAPMLGMDPKKQVTCILGGDIEIHTKTPGYTSTIGGNISLFAACAAMQASNPSLVPVITIGDQSIGSASGAPRAASVPTAESIIALFDSAASRAGGALEMDQDASVFADYYNGLLTLNAAVGKPGTARSVATGQDAARLLGTNLANVLAPTQDDLIRYNIGPATRTEQAEIGKALIITAKAFRLGLTNMVMIPAFRDDPHGTFDDMPFHLQEMNQIGGMLNAFMMDLDVEDPTCAGSTVLDSTVLSIHGDTPRNPFRRPNWPDPSPGDCNVAFVYGAGYLKSGWFGQVDRTGKNSIQAWNPETGDLTAFSGAMRRENGKHAALAVAYAVAKGDERKVNLFSNTNINGILNLPGI